MITVMGLLIIGAILGVGGLFVWVWLDETFGAPARANQLARVELLRSEARLQQLTQDAVQQMLAAAQRQSRRRD